MIRIEVEEVIDIKPQLDPFLAYVTEKMASERSDSHDTATLAYVILRTLRDKGMKAGLGWVEHWISNDGARAACRELGMFLSYQSTKGMDLSQIAERYRIVREVREQIDQNIKRQDGEKWARERDKIARSRPTVREHRSAS